MSRRQTEKEAICAADDGSMPPLHLLQRSERHTKIAAYPWGALHATEDLGPGADFRQMKVPVPSPSQSLNLHSCHAADGYLLQWEVSQRFSETKTFPLLPLSLTTCKCPIHSP